VSNYVRLVCFDHDPPLIADDESGQHLSDLDQIRADIAMPIDELISAVDTAPRVAPFEPDPTYFRRHTMRFRVAHPRCRIGIRDECGVEHPIEQTEADHG
jgi:hypothetical protein